MACFSPILLLRKKKLVRCPDGSFEPEYSYSFYDCPPEHRLDGSIRTWTPDGEILKVRCGKCIGCLLDRSRMWADRCMLEMQYHESNLFVTLTYDDLHVPVSYYANPDTGEALPSLTLDRRDVQLFMKRLRKRTGQKIRYFGSGEYGSTTFRPHYHMIMFGLKLDDLELVGRSGSGHQYYTSPLLVDCWGKGFVSVAEATWETAAYTARYVQKKAGQVDPEFYKIYNIAPEFSMMSTHPGIGRQYYDDHRDEIYEHQEIYVSTKSGGRKIRPPAYYDRLYDLECPEEMSDIKVLRLQLAEARNRARLTRTDLTEEELNLVLEDYKKSSAKKLIRNTL